MPGDKKHHTEKFRSCVEKVMAEGKDEQAAYAICTTTFQESEQPIYEERAAEAPAEVERAAETSTETSAETDPSDGLRLLHLSGVTGEVRREMLDGRPHLVVPVVALMEGVIHAVNAQDAEFVPTSTLRRGAASWNGRPVVLGHPVKSGRQCTALTPDVWNGARFGTIFNSRVEGNRMLQEAWLDEEKVKTLHPKMYERLLAKQPVEVSVGALAATDTTSGTHNGKSYKAVWREATGDHLAFLPDGRGACSVAMGCGTYRAAGNYSEHSPMLYTLSENGPEPIERELAFDESKHNRDEHGRFTDGDGGGGDGGDDDPDYKGADDHFSKNEVKTYYSSITPKAIKEAKASSPDAFNKGRDAAIQGNGRGVSSFVEEVNNWIEKNDAQAFIAGFKQGMKDARPQYGHDKDWKGAAAKYKDCEACDGSGSKDGNPCEVCDGTGQVEEKPRYAELLRVLMPRGWGDDEVKQDLRDALLEVEPQARNGDIVRVTDSALIYCVYPPPPVDPYSIYDVVPKLHYYERPYSFANGKFTLGERYEVEPTTVYERKAAEASRNSSSCGCGGHDEDACKCKEVDEPALDRVLTEKAAAGDAAFKAAMGLPTGVTMTTEQKTALIKQLVEDKYSGFTSGDEKMLEAASDDRLESFRVASEARKTREAELKAAAEKKTLTREELMEIAPPELKTLIKRQEKQETEQKAALIVALKAAQSEYSETELSVMPVEELQRMARLAKVEPKTYDMSGRGVPRSAAAGDEEDFTPPNPYEKGLKALQAAR